MLSGWRGRQGQARERKPLNVSAYSAWVPTACAYSFLKRFGDDLARFFAQEVHHLSFTVETHHPPGNVPCMFNCSGADDLLHLRHIWGIQGEDVQLQPKQQESV